MSDSAGPLLPRAEAAPPASQRAGLRASDADREQVAELLRVATGEGRLDFAELDERLTAAYAAKTYGELEPLVADLVAIGAVPLGTHLAGPSPAPAGMLAEPETLELRTRSGNVKQRGHWVVPESIFAACTSGNVKIDFTEAVCRHPEIYIDATCGAGNITMVVPRGWQVRIEEATSGMGNIRNKVTDPPTPGAPTIVLAGRVRSGNITVRYAYRSSKR